LTNSEGKEYVPQFVAIYDMQGLALRQFNSPAGIKMICMNGSFLESIA